MSFLKNFSQKIEKEKTIYCNGLNNDENGFSDSQNLHPIVYLTILKGKDTVCPYCSKTFKW